MTASARRLWIFCCTFNLGYSLSVSDFVSASSACASEFSCEAAAASEGGSTPICRCDANCADYGECCYDAPTYDSDKQMQNLERQQCIYQTNMFNKCAKQWENSDVASLCSQHSPLDISKSREPILHVPVTSKDTNFTYINYFCALCNYDATNILMWESKMQCFFQSYEKTEKENLILLMDYLNLQHSNNDQYQREELTNTTTISDDLIEEERVTGFIKSNLKFSENEKKWLISVPTSEPMTMECSFKLSLENTHAMPFRCSPSIHTCAANWTDKETEQLCHSFSAQIEYYEKYTIISNRSEIVASAENDPIAYRNIYCAKCNYAFIAIPCMVVFITTEPRYGDYPPIPPFSILLQTPDSIQRKNWNDSARCKDDEDYFPIFNSCNSILCQFTDEIYGKGLCVSRNKGYDDRDGKNENGNSQDNKTKGAVNTSRTERISCGDDDNNGNDNIDNNTKSMSDSVRQIMKSNKCRKVLEPEENDEYLQSVINTTTPFSNNSCDKILILEKDFYRSKNGIIIKNSQSSYGPGTYEETRSGILVCSSNPTYFHALGWMSFVGLVISCISITLHLLAFVCVKELRNLPGKNLASLCICLLGGYITFITGSKLSPQSLPCYMAAAIMYFYFFASLCWMNVIAFDTWRSFKRAATHFHRRSGSQWKTYVKYSLYCWVSSIVALASMIIIDQLEPKGIPVSLLPKLGKSSCWFGHNTSLFLFFVGPMIISSIVTVSLYFKTSWIIYTVSVETKSRFDQIGNRNLLYVHISLAVLMGITWATGITAWYDQNVVSLSIFIIFNTMQGTFIFVAFTCKRKIWHRIKTICRVQHNENKCEINSCRTLSSQRQQKRMELLHVSTFMDSVHQPSRVHGIYMISNIA